MKWKSPDQKKSTFVKKFLKKDTAEAPEEGSSDQPSSKKNHAQWKVQKGTSSKFIADFFKQQEEDPDDDSKISLRVLGI